MWLLSGAHHQRQAGYAPYTLSFDCVAARMVRHFLPACPAGDSGNSENTEVLQDA